MKYSIQPIPPVANTFIPTKLATISVPATVVPPFNCLLSTYAKSRLDVLIVFGDVTGLVLFARYSNSVGDKPTLIRPFIIAIVAGIAFC